ncbi:L-serine ammonia-lyase, iron-sulfur-dependent subunit beta [Lacrimispora sp. 210928-DFI.3.58]|mgnify:CR=1 FL=1|uniref:L-serine ammonia-lyase, iron-sulfur-dependent subunit beta n=1 Tax=Lacrimispora sp. 210928-DFI.3.58 TaxID=2883214 RepID=UPI0015B51723|nr:L-serine ammonia-lyase, iron-sulfur-dependent subunit beta [Lacrimispora sp. 210928-DFI.3.58]MCB7319515.1 L-serine ammonia-lyase, iron-sulfur-dependent subunit beta [Lacrimispora sp. 210928-DFI.3.58]
MNVFDILGPVMIGPSSSHTAGAARIGRITRALLGAPAVKADILLHGSFAKTYKGHGTDKALIAGIMGMETDDSRIRQAPELAREQGLQVNISTGDIDGAHPNTARVTLTDSTGRQVSLLGSSVGGGNILVTEVNGMAVSITGQQTTLIVLHRDAPGTIASVTEVMAEAGANICNFRLSRQKRGGEAVMTIEVDGLFGEELNEKIKTLDNVYSSTMLQPI